MYKDVYNCTMTITVQVSDFRNNMAGYLAKLDEGWVLELKKGDKYVAKIVDHPKTKNNPVNMVDNILVGAEVVRKKYKIRSEAKNMEELTNEIDRIMYGVDRNGKELSA